MDASLRAPTPSGVADSGRATALLLEAVHPAAATRLTQSGVTVHRRAGALSSDALIAELRSLDDGRPLVVGVRSKTHVTAQVMDAVPNLAAVGAFCIGTDQVDLERARQGGVAVFNAPFSSTRSVAELVIGQIIMLSRRIFPRNRAAHAGRWDKGAQGSHEVRGKTLGIVGYGHIGSQVSVLAEALGMRVRYFDVITKLPLGNATAVASLAELMEQSDFLTLHVPDTEQTRGMIDGAAIGTLRRGSYLINASRGQVVDVPALRAALDEGHIAGAAIDVFPVEPASPSHPFESVLRGHDEVILTPHIGGSTEEAQANIGLEVANALGNYLAHGASGPALTVPQLDAPAPRGGTRLLNLHRNVPGVLSAINRAVADSGINIVGQHLATADDVSLVLVDLDVQPGSPQIQRLVAAVAGLETSLRTRLTAGR